MQHTEPEDDNPAEIDRQYEIMAEDLMKDISEWFDSAIEDKVDAHVVSNFLHHLLLRTVNELIVKAYHLGKADGAIAGAD